MQGAGRREDGNREGREGGEGRYIGDRQAGVCIGSEGGTEGWTDIGREV